MPLQRPKIRLFVEAVLDSETNLELDHDQCHYLLRVMRLGPGDEVALFYGRDGEWRAEVLESGRRACRLALRERLLAQPPAGDLGLLFAPLKRARLEIMVEKATELGVTRLQPVLTRYTAVRRLNLPRLAAHAREAAEQCGRLEVPALAEPMALDEVLAAWPVARPLYWCDERGGGRPAAAVFAAASSPADLLIGPEGGFAPDEAARLEALAAAVAVDLGPRLLRADTAGVVVLGLWQALNLAKK